jgi:hypothetical protein
LAPIEIETVCWKISLPKTTKNEEKNVNEELQYIFNVNLTVLVRGVGAMDNKVHTSVVDD